MKKFTFFADKNYELPPSAGPYRPNIPRKMASYVVFSVSSSEMESKS